MEHAGPAPESISTVRGFRAAMRPVMPALRAYARRLTLDPTDTEDLVQDTLVRAWSARERFESGTNFKAWLQRIARNSFLSTKRRSWRQVEFEPEIMERVANEGPAQEAAFRLGELAEAVGALPTPQKEAFRMIAIEGRNYEEVARQLGVELGTLKSRVSRARAAITLSLEQGIAPRAATIAQPVLAPAASPGSRYLRWKKSDSRMIG